MGANVKTVSPLGYLTASYWVLVDEGDRLLIDEIIPLDDETYWPGPIGSDHPEVAATPMSG